jgi:N-acetylated-alpha-linked acidic dipeptidase
VQEKRFGWSDVATGEHRGEAGPGNDSGRRDGHMRNAADVREKQLLAEVSRHLPKALLERFATLVRESGSEGEREAASFIQGRLEELGVPHRVHYPSLYLSLPRAAGLRVVDPVEKEILAKTPAFSISTGGEWIEGEMVYVPTGYASGIGDIFGGAVEGDAADLEGKVVLTEGLPMPGKVAQFAGMGVKAAVFVAPGERIHEGICTTIWGAPDLDNAGDEPKIPVLAVNKPDGDELAQLCRQGSVRIEFKTKLEKGWYPCPLIDVFIEGTEEPEKYVLLHGHLDSWHEGIGDNATGDATLLEMARVFHEHRDALRKSVRIAIWPGHSYGRYAGSTWFADEYALDLEENCIAQVNCDSPGCRWATSYEHMMWMSEADEFCKDVVRDVVGQPAVGTRPLRAGDYSFNNIGITSFFMLSSTMPEELVAEKGYYPVGGCGGNIEWHTEDDRMHIADLDVLEKDMRIYAAAVMRAANAPVHPFDFAATAEELAARIRSYDEAAGVGFDLRPALEEAEALREDLVRFREEIEALGDAEAGDERVREVNEKIRRLARILVPINFSRRGKFWHDPALDVPPLPDLSPATRLRDLEEGSHERRVTLTHLTRGRNRVVWALREARRTVAQGGSRA